MGDLSMTHIEELIGAEARQAIAEKLGGARIVIPKTIGIHHPLGDAIGVELGQVLSQAVAGAVLDVPVTARKRALIREALQKGQSTNSIAARYYCSPRYVWILKAEMQAESEPKQASLL